MILLEAERLVRKISELLKDGSHETHAARLAQDYSELCQNASHRLEQCGAMLAAGDEHQALQLADAPPALLDLITLMSFKQAPAWREWCKAHSFPTADPFDGKPLRQLHDAYAKGIAPDHPLFKDYRRAMLRGQDEEALAVLRAIHRRNRADAQAERELARLEEKISKSMLERLRAAVAADDTVKTLATLDHFEALSLRAPPGDPAWAQAMIVRCLHTLTQAQSLRVEKAWQRAEPLIERVRGWRDDYGLSFDAITAEAFAELDKWVSLERKAFTEDRKYQRATAELQQTVERFETRQISSVVPSLNELRYDLAGITKAWHAVEQFGRGVPDDLPARTHKAEVLLRGEITRKTRAKRNAAVIGAAAFVIVCAAVAAMLFASSKARDLAAELQRFQSTRQVAAAEKLLEDIRARDARLASKPALRAAIDAAETFVEKERQQRQACESGLNALQELATRNFAGIAPEQVQSQFAQAAAAYQAAAPDFQPALHARLASLNNQWETRLESLRERRAADFQTALQAAERIATTELSYAKGPEAVGTGLVKLAPSMASLAEHVQPPVPQLVLPERLTHAFDALKTRVGAFANQVESWDRVTTALSQPTTFEAHAETLKELQRCEFAPPGHARAAAEVTSLNLTPASFAGALLVPELPNAVNAFQRAPVQNFFPEEVMPAERAKFNELRDDENIHNTFAYKLTEKALPSNDRRRTRIVFARGRIGGNRFGKPAGAVYDPVKSPNRVDFKNQVLDAFDFDLEDLGATKETEAFERSGLKELLDANTGRYRAALLPVLDQLNQDTAASPLFRAYLALRLFDLMELQPLDWGTQWAPGAITQRQRLRELSAGSIRSGDWMAPDRVSIYAHPLEEIFQQARAVSFARQALFFNKLTRTAADAGFTFAGSISADSALIPVPNSERRGELWGLIRGTKKAGLLFRVVDGRASAVNGVEPLPFSPVFVFNGDRRELLDRTAKAVAVSASDPSIAAYLPPLFAAP